MKLLSSTFYKDIRFWILLFFVVRLIGITNPPLDAAHSWRQVTGNMVSRNFLETDANIFYPRVDMAGEKTGITGTEFPLLNYLIYLVSLLFGWQHWYGRLIVLIVSSIGTYFFYKITRRFWKEETAFYATILLLVSNWFIYSRKIMPDTFSISLMLIGVYFAIQFIDNNKRISLLWSWLFIVMGALSKIPSILVLSPIILFYFDKSLLNSKKIYLGICLTTAMIPVVWWYFYWVPYLVHQFNYWHYYMGTTISSGIKEIGQNLPDSAEKFYFDALKYSGFALFLFGVFKLIITSKINKSSNLLSVVLLVSVAVFALFMAKAGRNFWVHSYYILPFVPVMSLVVGYGLSAIKWKSFSVLLLVIISVEGIANQQHDFRIKEKEWVKLNYENWANSISKPADLFIVNGGDNPKDLYFLHRKGWTVDNEKFNNTVFLDSLTQCGARFLLINKSYENQPKIEKTIAFQNESIVIFQLK
jgi:4-amino-4-deoxy-L-arabinose transferase-like glycosyltransferase